MNRRTLGFAVFAVLVSAGCVRLGIWQLSRLAERRARNAIVERRLAESPSPFDAAVRDSATARYRQVLARGAFDYEREVVFVSRTRKGAPGVHLLTPLRLADGRAILVNRGWVYSPNGMTVEQAPWREGDSASVSGYLEEFEGLAERGGVATPSVPRGVRRLVRDSVARLVGYPLAPFVLVRQDGRGDQAEVKHPFRIEPPALGDGSHRSYAIQWFAFALIGLVGAGIVATRGRALTAKGAAPTPSLGARPRD